MRGDITRESVDAIVNAANTRLRHGGGVAGAIARRGGPTIQRESDAIGYVATGCAAVTSAGDLPCRYVIHAVGPIWGSGNEDALLRSAVQSALTQAEEVRAAAVSFPAISSGIYGFPKDRCAKVMLAAISDHFRAHPDSCVRNIRICLIDDQTVRAFEDVWPGTDHSEEASLE